MKMLLIKQIVFSFLAAFVFASCNKEKEIYSDQPIPRPSTIPTFPVVYIGLLWDQTTTGLKFIIPHIPFGFLADDKWLGEHVKIELEVYIPISRSIFIKKLAVI